MAMVAQFVVPGLRPLPHSPTTSTVPSVRITRTQPSTRSHVARSLSTIVEDTPRSDHTLMKDCFDLPPITHMKSAIGRQRVSEGISYVLPVDKASGGNEGLYRTNLRLMFKEPYVTHGSKFNEHHMTEASKHHLQPNTRSTLLDPRQRLTKSADDWQLSMESEKVRLAYSYSAPSTGITGRATAEERLRPRSTLFLPLKARVPPEAIKLKEEAERIIKSVQEKDYRASTLPDSQLDHLPEPVLSQSQKLRRVSRHLSIYPDMTFLDSDDSDDEGFHTEKKASCFKSYEEFKKFKPLEKRPLPQELKSKHLSVEKCEQIWDWLNNYEKITEFSHFMQVCD